MVRDDEALHLQALADHVDEVVRARGGGSVVVLGNHAAHGQPAEGTHVFQRRHQMLAAHILEIDVDALGRGFAHRFGEIAAGLVVDRLVDAGGLFQPLALVIGAGGADHEAALGLGDLADDGTHGTGRR